MSERVECWGGDRVMVRLWRRWEVLLFAGDDESIVLGIEVHWGTRNYPSLYVRVMSFGLSLFRRDPPDPLFARRVRTKREKAS